MIVVCISSRLPSYFAATDATVSSIEKPDDRQFHDHDFVIEDLVDNRRSTNSEPIVYVSRGMFKKQGDDIETPRHC